MGFGPSISEELRGAPLSRSLIVRSSCLNVLARSGSDSASLAQRDRGKKIKGWIFEADSVSGTS